MITDRQVYAPPWLLDCVHYGGGEFQLHDLTPSAQHDRVMRWVDRIEREQAEEQQKRAARNDEWAWQAVLAALCGRFVRGWLATFWSWIRGRK